MRLVPRSLYGRLALLSAAATTVALVIAAFAIGNVLERVVMQGLDQRLDAQLALLATSVQPDGRIDPARLPASPRGWSWRIETPIARAGSLDIATARQPHRPGPPPELGPPPPPGEIDSPGQAAPFDLRDGDGERQHARLLIVPTWPGPARVAVAAPRWLVSRPIREAMVPLAVSLAILGLALGAATLVQLRLGLRPVRQLQAAVAAIRRGAAHDLPLDQPDELQPLASELNALVADNQAALAAARTGSANLAHALKTPLAALSLELRAPGRDPDGTLAPLVARIDATLRHHLGRARAAVGDRRAVTALSPALPDLAATIQRIHAARGVTIVAVVAPGLIAAIDPNDLDELIGNLVDNAARNARTAVQIDAVASSPRTVTITVADDGPGIDPADRARATAPGARLDEAGDGHGFGLAIARELAALYGGTLTLDDAPAGGLLVIVTLPLAT